MTLRELFIDWLTSSRYIRTLEARHVEQRHDFTSRLAEKDEQIKQLRVDVAWFKLHQISAPPAIQEVAPPVVPAFSGPDDWQAELNKMYQEEEHGISIKRREVIHEPSADDVSQQEP